MGKIKLNDILHLSEEEMKNSKIELNMSEGRNGIQYIDKWLSLSDKKNKWYNRLLILAKIWFSKQFSYWTKSF